MIGRLFGKKQRRTLLNGVQDPVEVTTGTYEISAPLWFAETYKLARNLSTTVRSVAARFRQALERKEDAARMTAEGAIPHDLWGRLAEFGYTVHATHLTPQPNLKCWSVRATQLNPWSLFLRAAKVEDLMVSVLQPISKGLSKNWNLFMGRDASLLKVMRWGTLRGNRAFADGRIKGSHFDVVKQLGLANEDGEHRVATRSGSLVLPFVLDHVLYLKGEDAMEQTS